MEQYKLLLGNDGKIIKDLYTKDFYKRLFELLEEIPAQRREVFVHSFIQGMKAKEIAELMDIPQRTIESHLYLAVKYLKKRMSKKDFFLLVLAFCL